MYKIATVIRATKQRHTTFWEHITGKTVIVIELRGGFPDQGTVALHA